MTKELVVVYNRERRIGPLKIHEPPSATPEPAGSLFVDILAGLVVAALGFGALALYETYHEPALAGAAVFLWGMTIGFYVGRTGR